MIRLNGEVAISKYGLEILKGIKDSIGFFLDDSPLELSLSEGLADEGHRLFNIVDKLEAVSSNTIIRRVGL